MLSDEADKFMIAIAHSLDDQEYHALGQLLGYSETRLKNIKHQNSHNTEIASLRMLLAWRDHHGWGVMEKGKLEGCVTKVCPGLIQHLQGHSRRKRYTQGGKPGQKLLYRVSQKNRNGGFSVPCILKVVYFLTSLDKASSAEENDTKIIKFG